MKNLNCLFIFIFCVVTFLGCSTHINVRVNRPAEVDLSFVETIAIIPFAEDPSFWDYVLFGTDEYKISKYFTSRLETKLSNAEYFKVVTTSKEYGTIPPCDAYISGSIHSLNTNIKQKERIVKDEKTQTEKKIIEFFRVLEFSISYRIIDQSTGNVLKKFEDSYSLTSEYESEKSKVPTACDLAKSELNDVISDLIRKITPYTTSKSISLLKDKSKNSQMEYADSLVKEGNLVLAYNEFMKVYETTNMFEAGYNCACILEAQNKYEEAETFLQDLYNKTGNSKALDLLKDVQYEIKQRDKLIQQNKNRGMN